MAHTDYAGFTDYQLKQRAIWNLALGVVPFEQWGGIFAHEDPPGYSGLRNKAFTVWFPTMTDYIRATADQRQIGAELTRRGIVVDPVPELADTLDRHFRRVLGLYTRGDQAFLGDRRLQNVHGALAIYTRDPVRFHWYDPTTDEVRAEKVGQSDYRGLLLPYYKTMTEAELALLERLLASNEGQALASFFLSHLTGGHLGQLASGIGASIEEWPG